MRRGWTGQELVQIPDTVLSHIFLSRLAAVGVPVERICTQREKTRPAFVDGGRAAYASHLDQEGGASGDWEDADDGSPTVDHVVIEPAHYMNRVPRVLAPLRYGDAAAVWAVSNYDPQTLESMLALSDDEDTYRQIIEEQYRKATNGRS